MTTTPHLVIDTADHSHLAAIRLRATGAALLSDPRIRRACHYAHTDIQSRTGGP